jgi:hypothetical protein
MPVDGDGKVSSALCHTPDAARTVYGPKATVAQQQHAIGHLTNARELVSRDDGRAASVGPGALQCEWRLIGGDAPFVVDQQETGSVLRLCHWRRELRRGGALDGASVDATKSGETMEKGRRSRTAGSEYRDAFPLFDVEGRTAEYPDPRRASRDAGGVALPEGASTERERHGRKLTRSSECA